MKLPKQVVLAGAIATATPEPDSELTARLNATAPCLWCVLARGLDTPGFLLQYQDWLKIEELFLDKFRVL
jgi:hypothetical protein